MARTWREGARTKRAKGASAFVPAPQTEKIFTGIKKICKRKKMGAPIAIEQRQEKSLPKVRTRKTGRRKLERQMIEAMSHAPRRTIRPKPVQIPLIRIAEPVMQPHLFGRCLRRHVSDCPNSSHTTYRPPFGSRRRCNSGRKARSQSLDGKIPDNQNGDGPAHSQQSSQARCLFSERCGNGIGNILPLQIMGRMPMPL